MNEIPERVEAALAEKRKLAKQYAKKIIWVTFQREGIHQYPDAATNPALATGGPDDVSFLAHPHRHMFHFRVGIEVSHSDRAIEFIQFKRWCETLFNTGILQLNYKSCEMIAEDLYEQIATRYPDVHIEIDVSEDGENGAHLVFAAS